MKRLAVALALFSAAGLAQRFGGGGIRFEGQDEGLAPVFPKEGEFHFIRVEYTDLPQFHRGFGFGSRNGQGEGWWIVDWPDADDHFSQGVERLTRVNTGEPAPPAPHRRPHLRLPLDLRHSDRLVGLTMPRPRACANTCCAAAF